jgi:hypothetical protein
LYSRRNHHYDAPRGRFTQEDPIGLAGGLNLYGFGGGDPINFSDPFGLCAIAGAASSVAIGSGLAAATGSGYGWGSAAIDVVAGAICVGAVARGFQAYRAGRAAARAAAAVDRVIGHYPEYLQVGEAIGARAFSIAPDVWRSMSPAAQWAANKNFLDEGIAAGAEFVMATRRGDIRVGTALAKEVDYLLQRGYQWAENGLSLIPK